MQCGLVQWLEVEGGPGEAQLSFQEGQSSWGNPIPLTSLTKLCLLSESSMCPALSRQLLGQCSVLPHHCLGVAAETGASLSELTGPVAMPERKSQTSDLKAPA